MSGRFFPSPLFADGDVLSAARLNLLLNNIDLALGLSRQRQVPFDAGTDIFICDLWGKSFVASNNGRQVELWLCHNGDRLVILHGGIELSGTTAPCTVIYNADSDSEQVFNNVAANSPQTLTLDTSELTQYQPVKIRITEPGGDLFVRYVYQTNSSAPSYAGLPIFANGDVSAAADLNQIIDAAAAAYQNLSQPVPCSYSLDKAIANQITYRGWIQHWHSKFYANMTIVLPPWENPSPPDTATWLYNNQVIWTRDFPLPVGNPSRFIFDSEIEVAVPAGLTPGAWYPVEFAYSRASDAVEQQVRILAAYEKPSLFSGNTDPLTRWQHGDPANGNAGTFPRLASMTNSLNGLLPSLRWVNQPCRAAGSYIMPNCTGEQRLDPFTGTRTFRWLAYKSRTKADDKLFTAQLEYFTGVSRETKTVTLPEAKDKPTWYDLDNTPIKPGMWFRLTGVEFGIQAPQPGVSYG